MSSHWVRWHAPYDDPASSLSARLRAVQDAIRRRLDADDGPVRAVSLCAGQGHDLLGVLRERPDAHRVTARLVELDPGNAAAARAAARDLPGVEVVTGDASVVGVYAGAVPADLVLACGIFGNVTDADVRRTVTALPRLCAPAATVVWTRHRQPPDLTPAIREWFAAAGFAEEEWVAPEDDDWAVGAHRLVAEPAPLGDAGDRLFVFRGDGAAAHGPRSSS